MDKNQFFREASLKICGNLEIHEAMQDCMHVLSTVIPMEAIYMQVFEERLGSMRVIAKATQDECSKMDLLIPLPQYLIDMMAEEIAELETEGRSTWISNDPDEDPVSEIMLQALNLETSSVLGNLLYIKDRPMGSVVCLTKGKNRYTEEHMEYLDLLREPFYIALSNALSHREVLKLKDLLMDDNRYLQGELRRLSGDEIVGANFGLREVLFRVQQVAGLDSPVLLLGETGTGKDIIANAIHYSSARSDGPFVSVNCGAIPDTLIDSELFGHEKGAFTGALSQKRGRFERANNGTIFLDEIGELPLPAQVRLLRVLQSHEIERVGGVKTIPLDIRIIAATNRNLDKMVKSNQFREDLWFRLNVFPIQIPPLRQRSMDIPSLIQHFISLKARELKLPSIPTLSPGALEPLMAYTWPGNVRELQNVIERALILNPSGPLTFDHLEIIEPSEPAASPVAAEGTDDLDQVIANHIRHVLSKTAGKVSGHNGAAAKLGVNPSTLRNRMKKLGIRFGRKNRT